MAKIIFFTSYPANKDLQDGFYVRVKNIDDVFVDVERIYLSVSFLRNFKLNIKKTSNNLTTINANLFLHYFQIRKTLKTSSIYYIQSLYNYLWTLLFSIKKDKKVIWDVHGAVPEELSFYEKKIPAYILGLVEKLLASRADLTVCVTKSMCDYLNEKYSKITPNNIVYPIINKQFLLDADSDKINLLRDELGISSKDIVFVYSGSLIKWQRFDDVLKVIQKLENPNYRYIILTGQVEEAEKKIADFNLSKKRILVRTAKPNELSTYYSLSHFGFILRENHVLNRVAAPTKLLEYLYYGLTPVVDYKEIGDFYYLGYEHISYTDVSDNMLPRKSEINNKILKAILANNKEKYFYSLVLPKKD